MAWTWSMEICFAFLCIASGSNTMADCQTISQKGIYSLCFQNILRRICCLTEKKGWPFEMIKFQPFLHVLYLHVAVSLHPEPDCTQQEFQCHSKADGCIPLEKSCDGWIDCMRDGSDESPVECNTGTKH